MAASETLKVGQLRGLQVDSLHGIPKRIDIAAEDSLPCKLLIDRSLNLLSVGLVQPRRPQDCLELLYVLLVCEHRCPELRHHVSDDFALLFRIFLQLRVGFLQDFDVVFIFVNKPVDELLHDPDFNRELALRGLQRFFHKSELHPEGSFFLEVLLGCRLDRVRALCLCLELGPQRVNLVLDPLHLLLVSDRLHEL